MKFLAELRKILTCHIKNAVELDDKRLTKLLDGIIENIRHDYVGKSIYIPTNHRELALQRRKAILAEIKRGVTDRELCGGYGISLTWAKKLRRLASGV